MSIGNMKLLIALLALAPLSALAGEMVDERWDIDAKATVSIENIAGEIVVQGWNKKEARLTGELGNSVEELEIEASKSSLQIRVKNRNERNVDNTELKLMVPKGASVDISGVSADVDVSGLDNEKLTASSVSVMWRLILQANGFQLSRSVAMLSLEAKRNVFLPNQYPAT